MSVLGPQTQPLCEAPAESRQTTTNRFKGRAGNGGWRRPSPSTDSARSPRTLGRPAKSVNLLPDLRHHRESPNCRRSRASQPFPQGQNMFESPKGEKPSPPPVRLPRALASTKPLLLIGSCGPGGPR